MTAVVKCPQCGLQLALPDNVARESLARCPVCRETFALKDVDIAPVLPLVVIPTEQEFDEAGEETGSTDECDEPSSQGLATSPDVDATSDLAGDESALVHAAPPEFETSGAVTEPGAEQADEERAVVEQHVDEPASAYPDEYLDEQQSTYVVEDNDAAESADVEPPSDPLQADNALQCSTAEDTVSADPPVITEEHIELEARGDVGELGSDVEFHDDEIEIAEATGDDLDGQALSEAETVEFSDGLAAGDITWQETEPGSAEEAEVATTVDAPDSDNAADLDNRLVAAEQAGQAEEPNLSAEAGRDSEADGSERTDVADSLDQPDASESQPASDERAESESTSLARVPSQRDSEPRTKKKGRATDWELLAANAARNRGPGFPLRRVAAGVGIGAVLLVAGYTALLTWGGPGADVLGVVRLWGGAREPELESGTPRAAADRDRVVQASAVEESDSPAVAASGGSPALVAPAEFAEDVAAPMASPTDSGQESTMEADLAVGRYGERYSSDATAAAPPPTTPPEPTRYVEVVAELSNVPKYEFEHLMAAHSAALATRRDLLGPDIPDNLKAIAYARSCDLSQALTFLEGVQQLSGDPSRAEAAMLRLEAKDFFRKALLDESAWPELGRLATAWIRSPYRPHGGIFLVGKRLRGRKRGSVFEYPVDTGFGEPVMVLTEGSLSKTVYPPGGYMAVVGSVIESPAEQVSGYDGTAKPVVWSGFTIPLQTAPSNGVRPIFRVF